MKGKMNIHSNKKLLAVASGGGHWVQLLRLLPAFDGLHVEFVSTNKGYASQINNQLHVVTDANMWEKLKLIKMFIQVAFIVFKVKPDFIITTGAAPGYAAIMFGKLIGAKTIWLDSIANSETLSSSGKKARIWADVWLTQWPHLVDSKKGLETWGSVL